MLHFKFLGTVILCASVLAQSVSAKDQTVETEVVETTRSHYTFKQPTTPSGMTTNDIVIYTFANNKIYTITGVELAKLGGEIIDLQVSPALINMAALVKNKKDTTVTIIDVLSPDEKAITFSKKKYGIPTAIAYTPDARRFLMATGNQLKVFDSRTFLPISEIALPLKAVDMAVSPNNNFLVVSDGHKVSVINFEENKVRKTWTFDENVNAIGFSRDNTQLAILTDDGLMTIYDTINFLVKKTLDDLGEGIDGNFNFDGKYVGVVTSPNAIEVVNVLSPDDKETVAVDSGMVNNVKFITDYRSNTLLAYNTKKAVEAKRMPNLEPYYGKLISDEVNELMNEWLKMMPGETMEEYRARVSPENRTKQRQLFEAQISTRYAGDLMKMATVTLGKYDRAGGLLELGLGNMPSILLPVPENEVAAFSNTGNLQFSETRYGIMPNDNFELIYAKIHNGENGKDYIYDNLDRKPLEFMGSESDLVSIEVLQQQQMEEARLQELRQRVVEEARNSNVITDHTNITVDSRIVPDYNADGKKILNYQINFSYEVEPGFSAQEDFAPGKYEVKESGAASSMLSIVKQAFEGDLAQYLEPGKKLKVKVYGNADGMPIARKIPYSGVYGDIENELVYQNGQLKGISVDKKGGITDNEQLAFLRAYGVVNYLNENVEIMRDLNKDYQYYIEVLEDKGGEFRRITAEFTIVDVF